jgi:hypothetical protein
MICQDSARIRGENEEKEWKKWFKNGQINIDRLGINSGRMT